jgi:hypothetical protein
MTRKRGTREVLGDDYQENHTYLNQTTTLWDVYAGSMEEIVGNKIESVIKDFMGALLAKNRNRILQKLHSVQDEKIQVENNESGAGPSSGEYREILEEADCLENILRGEELKRYMKKRAKEAIGERFEKLRRENKIKL